MARRVVGALVVVSVIALVSVWVRAQSGKAGLEGAWQLQEITTAKPGAGTPNKPIGMLLFTGNHFAVVSLLDSSPRPAIGASGQGAKTIEELRAAWGPVRAQAGTFQVSGDKVTLRATVAKGSEPMASDAFSESTFSVKGDTLVLVSTRTQTGPTANPTTQRFTRAK